MKILTFGLDQTILNPDSKLAERARFYGSLLDRYIVLVPYKENKKIELSDKVTAYGVKSSNKILGLWSLYKLGKKLLKQESFDIISAQDQYFVGAVAYKLARKFKLGLEIQIHGFEKFYGLRKIIAKKILPQADSIRVVSQRLKKQLVKDFGVKEEKITVVPIFVDTSHGLSKVERVDNKFIFMSVGRLVEVKNFLLQFLAIKELSKDFPQVKLFVLGTGPMETELKQVVKVMGLNSIVEFKGWVDGINEYYQNADAFVLSSNSEGWGMVVISASSFALPIIMTDVGCAGEVIKNRESGLVVPVGGKKASVEAMRSIIRDEKLRDSLGKAAKQAVSKLPNQEQTLGLYKQSWQKALTK